MLLAASLFGIGVFFDQPTCKTIAKWLWLLALVVAFIPLASLALMSVVERFRKK